MDIVSMTLGAYLNISNGVPADVKNGFIHVAKVVKVETDKEKLERLFDECNLQTSIAMMARKDEPLTEFDKACGAYYKFRDEYKQKHKNKI